MNKELKEEFTDILSVYETVEEKLGLIKEFGSMSEFKDEKEIVLYRSSNPELTRTYYKDGDYFEILSIGYPGQGLFIRYPGKEHFIRLFGGIGSGWGSMGGGSGKNVWCNKFDRDIQIFHHERDLCLKMGKWSSNVNFLTLVGKRTKDSPAFYKNNPTSEKPRGEDQLQEALDRQYLKLPLAIRTVAYMKKLKDVNEEFFILIDYPTYHSSYETHRIRTIGKNRIIKEYKILEFERYRDGGTTEITLVDEQGDDHMFFSPTPFEKEKSSTWNGQELVDVTDEKERIFLMKLFDIKLEPKDEER